MKKHRIDDMLRLHYSTPKMIRRKLEILSLVNLNLRSLLNYNIYTSACLLWLRSWAKGGKTVLWVARGGEMLGMSVWCEWPAHRSLRSQVGAQVAGAGPGTGHPTPAQP